MPTKIIVEYVSLYSPYSKIRDDQHKVNFMCQKQGKYFTYIKNFHNNTFWNFATNFYDYELIRKDICDY
jgi:hypothetical protein